MSLIPKSVLKFGGAASDGENTRRIAIAAAAMLCTFLPFEASHLFFMVAGAVLYMGMEVLGSGRKVPSEKMKTMKTVDARQYRPQTSRAGVPQSPAAGPVVHKTPQPQRFMNKSVRDKPATPPRRTPIHDAPVIQKAMPPTAPTFKCAGSGWNAEVSELLDCLFPTSTCHACADDLAKHARQMFQAHFPEIEIKALVTGNLTNASARACGVAVPDVSLCLQINPGSLTGITRKLKSTSTAIQPAQDAHKLALRACLQRYTAVGMKFKRSAFTGAEPKVTFVIPKSFGFHADLVPVDMYVNSCTPQRNSTLLDACGEHDLRVKQLAYLVKRWAKDRGICMSSKGHLPPYAWTLLCIYYFQVGVQKQSLPAFSGVRPSSTTKEIANLLASAASTLDVVHSESIGDLLKDFFRFYALDFTWEEESISVRNGCRLTVARDESSVFVRVEDPFDGASNVADCVNTQGLARLREELRRAHELCSSCDNLSMLLEPWAPPVAGDAQEPEDAL